MDKNAGVGCAPLCAPEQARASAFDSEWCLPLKVYKRGYFTPGFPVLDYSVCTPE